MEVEEPFLLSNVVQKLVLQYPFLSDSMNDISVAVNKVYIRGDTNINENDEIAFLPPMSGG